MESASTTPPEVVFHRYFQTSPLPTGLEHIKGKQDLSKLPDDLGNLLTDIQLAFNRSFALSRSSLAELGHPLPVHLDYLESEKESAHAFESGGLRFIGITIPLVERLRDSAERLARAEEVIALLRLSGRLSQHHNATGGIFAVKLRFVAAHEFGHHLLGHTSDPRPEQRNNAEDSGGGRGSLEQQAEENLADGYAVFLTLGFLIGGPQGQQVLEMLGHGETPRPDADTILLSTLLLSTFGFFSGRLHEILDAKSLFTSSHPPAFARVNGIIQTTRVWCQRYSPSLDSWLTQDHLEEIMNAEENSRPGGAHWVRQIEFFMSPAGAQYFERLGEQLSRITPPGRP